MDWVFKQSPPDWTTSLRRLKSTTLNMTLFTWMVEMNDHQPKIKWNVPSFEAKHQFFHNLSICEKLMFRHFALKLVSQGTNKKLLVQETWSSKWKTDLPNKHNKFLVEEVQTVASWITSKFRPFPVKIVSSYNIETWVIIWTYVMCVWWCVVWAVTVASLSLVISAYHFLIMPESPIFCILSNLLFWYIIMRTIKLFAMCL
jgi:hypothetical protein